MATAVGGRSGRKEREEIETTWWRNLPPKGTENQIIWTGCLVEEGVVLYYAALNLYFPNIKVPVNHPKSLFKMQSPSIHPRDSTSLGPRAWESAL